jgi:hypothetical protein
MDGKSRWWTNSRALTAEVIALRNKTRRNGPRVDEKSSIDEEAEDPREGQVCTESAENVQKEPRVAELWSIDSRVVSQRNER